MTHNVKEHKSFEDVMTEIEEKRRNESILSKIWREVRNWQPLYWLRCHTITRYHLVDARYKSYQWGYCDKDILMLNACFNLLVQFVEKEKPFEVVDWEETPECIAARKEIEYLVHWWLHEREEDSEIANHDVDTMMLHRLVSVRGYLWT